MSDNVSASSGIGFFGLLTIVFITLKLMGYISWSWWLVFLPMIINISIVILILIVCGFVFWIINK